MTELPVDPIERMKVVREQEVTRAWAEVLSSHKGRLVIWDILEQCGVYRSTYTGNAMGTFLEGQRQIGLWMLAERITAHSPRTFPEMQLEAAEFEERLRRLQDATQEDNADG